MTGIIALGYIGVTAPDLEDWKKFSTAVLGLTTHDGPDEGQMLLRMDERAWRISVEPGKGGLAFLGFEVAGENELADLVTKLEAGGVSTTRSPDLAAKRGVSDLVTFEDPAGHRLEVFYGARLPQEHFASPTGARFVTSAPGWGSLGFGHAVVIYDDESAVRKFFLDLLEFKVSDTLTAGPVTAYFTHVNGRHHSLAFAGIPGVKPHLNHFMLEVEDLDMVGRALDALEENGYPVVQTLGKHTNDHMVSFYTQTPSGFMLEFGCNGRLVDDATWSTSSYTSASYWGHKGEFPDGTVDV